MLSKDVQRIALWKNPEKRDQFLIRNKRLRLFHRFTALTIFIAFVYLGISDQELVEDYRAKGLLYYIALSYVSFFGAQIFAAGVMYIPAAIWARYVSPEILLCERHLIFVGGSQALNYWSYSGFLFPFYRYLLPIDDSQIVERADILTVGQEKARFLKPAFGLGSWIAIVHKEGKILTGIWLNEEEKKDIVGSIKKWAEEGAGTA